MTRLLAIGATAGAAVLALSAPAPALAERPMAVDDAGTLAKGGAKLEFGVSRDAKLRGWDAAAGFAPVHGLELELGLAGLRDRASSPAARIDGAGLAAKWVPLQSEHGLSAGLKFELGRERTDDRAGGRETSTAQALTALATWAFASGDFVHLNLGQAWAKSGGVRERLGTWGVGLDHPLGDALSLTFELFGVEHSGADKQIGLRWTVAHGLKLSVGLGRGNGRSFGSAGVAWEF